MAASTEAGATAAGGRWRRRLVVVVGAVLAALVVFLIADLVTDGSVRTPAMEATEQEATDLNFGAVIFVSALVSLLAWALLVVLERFTSRARTIWTIVAVLVLALSLGAPLSGTDTTTGSRVSLLLIHLAVAGVLIPFLPAGSAGRVRRQPES